ncbi:cache domain-containing protein, partial [Luteimonas sp. SJ-92]
MSTPPSSFAALRSRFAQARLNTRFLMLGLASAAALVALAGFGLYAEREALLSERQAAVRATVDIAHGLIEGYVAQAADGAMEQAEAQAQALDAVRRLRYGATGDDYFWINDMHPRMVMHPINAKLDGQDLSEYEDPEGTRLFVAFVDTVRAQGSGFVPYLWPKPGHEEPVAKLSFVRGVEAWGWVVGSGVYADDVDAAVWASARKIGAFFLATLAVLLGLGWLIARSIVGPLAGATAAARQIAAGQLDGAALQGGRDEVGQLLAAMQTMRERLGAVIAGQVEMERRHEAGEISYRIDSGAFEGAYAEMAAKTNALAASHIAVMTRLAELAQRYAIGDLSDDMPQLPGEKAALTEAMRATKHNLGAVNAEIGRLAAAAARGDFSARGDESQYQYAFREMVAALNTLMQEADAGLTDVGRIMAALADGDLTQRVERQHQGAFGDLAGDVNRTVERLATIVRGIQVSVASIRTASGEIAAGNSDLSARTEQQAASLEETASSMEELTSTVKANDEGARQANQLAAGAGEVAEAGGKVVAEVVTTMGAISESSRRIADIIGVIDGIAFQTNILALNAAVEAARAGEQGRGFAVVASEVRSLAQRSAAAAKEIKALIEDSTKKVELGTGLVDRAGSTMQEIVTSVKRVNDLMSEITAASAEQSSGIEQVNLTVIQLDEMTQQNAALVEEASAAARSLEEQAGGLATAVAVFRIGSDAA